jgi:hypothetical protein
LYYGFINDLVEEKNLKDIFDEKKYNIPEGLLIDDKFINI